MEITWLRRIDFFPPWRESFQDYDTLCIGTKSRNLGDALALTTLPEKLKAKYPHLKLTTYPRGFNPVVFENNPAIQGVAHLPRALYGDDINFGSGNLIQLKERFFDLTVSDPPRPRIHLSPQELVKRDSMLRSKTLPGNEGKPLCILHPWGTTRQQVASVEFWDSIVQRWADRYRFWQVGIFGHPTIIGCEYYLLTQRSPRAARTLFSIMSAADRFIGVDSGPMHVARAFNIPSLIFLSHLKMNSDFQEQISILHQEPYFLRNNRDYSVLYCENQHAAPSDLGTVDAFLLGPIGRSEV